MVTMLRRQSKNRSHFFSIFQFTNYHLNCHNIRYVKSYGMIHGVVAILSDILFTHVLLPCSIVKRVYRKVIRQNQLVYVCAHCVYGQYQAKQGIQSPYNITVWPQQVFRMTNNKSKTS